MPSLGRQFAEWVAALSYEDLPPEVLDRARSVTLHALSSALVGHGRDEVRTSLKMMREEEAGGGGTATVLVDGSKLTKAGAVFVNSEMTFAGGKWDTYRMLTHPGCAIVPAALFAALLTLAPEHDYRVMLEVDERDIGELGIGQQGHLALTALPF